MSFIPLETVKRRVAIALADTSKDADLNILIDAVATRFEAECRRGIRAMAGQFQEFRADERSIVLERYPLVELVKIEVKANERIGWTLREVDYLLRRNSIVEFKEVIGSPYELARIQYQAGYASPGTVAIGHPALPSDLQWAAAEQAAHWWLWKEKVGLYRHAEAGGGVEVEIRPNELLAQVLGVLRKYERLAAL